MAVISIKNKTKSGSLLVGNNAYIPSDYESIATAIGTGSSGAITFNSIPSTYSHLQIRYIGRSLRAVTGDSMRITFNSDSGSNYWNYHLIYGDGTSAAAGNNSTATFTTFGYAAGASAASNIVSGGIVDILDYANTNKYKTLRSTTGEDFNNASPGDIGIFSGLWMSTAAVNSISIVTATGSGFTTAAHFALYGIKG